MSVRPSAGNNSTPIGRIFLIFFVNILLESVEKIQVLSKSDRDNTGDVRQNVSGGVHATILAVEKYLVLHIRGVCLQP
jgi:hypothetical protein